MLKIKNLNVSVSDKEILNNFNFQDRYAVSHRPGA